MHIWSQPAGGSSSTPQISLAAFFFAVPTRSKGIYQSQLRNIANIIVVNKTADHKIQDKVAANSATETLRPARQAR